MKSLLDLVLMAILNYFGEQKPWGEFQEFSSKEVQELFPKEKPETINQMLSRLKKKGILQCKYQGSGIYTITGPYESKYMWYGADFIESILYNAFKDSPEGPNMRVVFHGVDWTVNTNDKDEVTAVIFHREKGGK